MKPEDLGIYPQLLIAGFAGGVAHAFAFKQTAPIAQVGSVVMGALVANYFSPAVASLPHVGSFLGSGGCAFMVGISAMAIIQGVAAVVQSKLGYLKEGEKIGRDQ